VAQPLLRAPDKPVRPFIGEVPGPTEGEVPLISGEYIQHLGLRGKSRCKFERTINGYYCGELSSISLDGLRLCRHHALRLRLEERVTYWRAMLAHVELWSGEARSRGRAEVVHLLELEQTRVSTALGRASEELAELEDGRNGDDGSGVGKPPWPPLYLLGLLLSGAISG
jgi:hypothetical protein